jgi:acyl-CoA thioesterase-1
VWDDEMSEYTVVALGDSITYGFPFTPQESWVEILRKETGWTVINAGVSGDTLGDMAARLPEDVLACHPDVVILLGGTNDVYQGISMARMEQNFLRILEALDKQQIKVWLGLPLPVDDYAERQLSVWREWLRAFGQLRKLMVIDFYQDFLTEGGAVRSNLFLDGVHPTREGYQVMGQRILKNIAPSIG